MSQRLRRNTRESILGGVAAGFGDYLDIDPVIIRLIFIVLCLAGGSGLILYVVCWLIMPRDDEESTADGATVAPPPADRFVEEVKEAGERVVDNIKRSASGPGKGRVIGGLILISLGLLFLVDEFWPLAWLRFNHLWPLLLIVLGVVLIARARRGEGE